MIISHERDVPAMRLNHPEVKDAVKRVLISPQEGWEGYVMRTFELGEGGHTPKHSHDWPHINYITHGKGILHLDGKDYELEAGSFAYIPNGKIHQFRNIGSVPFSLICIVPAEGDV